MAKDKAKHKILPPSKFGLIQITRQRVRPEINFVTTEANPNQESNEVEAPIVTIDKIEQALLEYPRSQRQKLEKYVATCTPFCSRLFTTWIAKHSDEMVIEA